jgi:hypothetical protein
VQNSYWYAGTDLLITSLSFHSPFYFRSNDDASVAARPYLGHENAAGFGIRGRLWLFGVDDEIQSSSSGIIETLEISTSSFDIDFYRRFFYDRTSFVLGAGTKAASISLDYESDGKDRVSGGGVSVFAEGQHPLYRGPRMTCSFLGYGRFALLTGQVDMRNWPEPWDEADTNMAITELGIGLELTRRLRRSEFVFQIVSEVQRWDANLVSEIAFDALGLRFGGRW